MTKPLNYLKVGGRDRPAPKRATRDVESQPCPERDGNHWLINRGAVTCCRGCGVGWVALDEALNNRRAT